MSAQLVVSPKVFRQNTTLFINLFTVSTGVSISFISVTSLPPLVFVASSTCTINGQSFGDNFLTSSRPHHDHLLLQFASAIVPSQPNIVCAVQVQFESASSSKVVNITTDDTRPTRGLTNTSVDACSAAFLSLSGIQAVVFPAFAVQGELDSHSYTPLLQIDHTIYTACDFAKPCID